MSPYDAVYANYLENEFSFVPLVAKNKMPAIKDWTVYCSRLPTEEEADGWSDKFPNANIGVCMGELWALDIDTDNPEVIRAIEDALYVSPIRRRGAKGYAAIFRKSKTMMLPTKSWLWKLEGMDKPEKFVEFFTGGRQMVVPPSIHPDTGQPYVWCGGVALDAVEMKHVPEAPEDMLQRIEKALEPWVHVPDTQRPRRDATAPIGPSPRLSLNEFNDLLFTPGMVDLWMPLLNSVKPELDAIKDRSGTWKMKSIWRETSTHISDRKRSTSINYMGIKDHSAGDTFRPIWLMCLILWGNANPNGDQLNTMAEWIRSQLGIEERVVTSEEDQKTLDKMLEMIWATAVPSNTQTATDRVVERERAAMGLPALSAAAEMTVSSDSSVDDLKADISTEDASAPEDDEDEEDEEDEIIFTDDELFENMGFAREKSAIELAADRVAVARIEPLDQELYKTFLKLGTESIPAGGAQKIGGLFERIFKYMWSNLPVVSNESAFFSACVIMTGMMQGRYRAELRDTRVNNYMHLLGGSGSGKSTVIEEIRRIMDPVNIEGFGMDAFVSSAAIETHLKSNEFGLCLIDEIGDYYGGMNSRNEHLKSSISMFTKLYSESSTSHWTQASMGRGASEKITNPHMSIFGVCPPENYWSSFGADTLASGLLARHMTFTMKDMFRGVGKLTPDQITVARSSLSEALAGFVRDSTVAASENQSFGIASKGITIKFQPDAKDFFDRNSNFQDQLGVSLIKENRKSFVPIANRITEKALKLAMMFAAGRNAREPEVGIEDARMAWSVSLWNASHMIHSHDSMGLGRFDPDYAERLESVKSQYLHMLPRGQNASLSRSLFVSKLLTDLRPRDVEMYLTVLEQQGVFTTKNNKAGNLGLYPSLDYVKKKNKPKNSVGRPKKQVLVPGKFRGEFEPSGSEDS